MASHHDNVDTGGTLQMQWRDGVGWDYPAPMWHKAPGLYPGEPYFEQLGTGVVRCNAVRVESGTFVCDTLNLTARAPFGYLAMQNGYVCAGVLGRGCCCCCCQMHAGHGRPCRSPGAGGKQPHFRYDPQERLMP